MRVWINGALLNEFVMIGLEREEFLLTAGVSCVGAPASNFQLTQLGGSHFHSFMNKNLAKREIPSSGRVKWLCGKNWRFRNGSLDWKQEVCSITHLLDNFPVAISASKPSIKLSKLISEWASWTAWNFSLQRSELEDQLVRKTKKNYLEVYNAYW